ncbi:MAG: hypothetical protein JOZ61_03360 [Verrucomicrobia bacterium]|jgi:hypothetical protein|nr:hypothetical protein [Verrucomicrobiota bacterium]
MNLRSPKLSRLLPHVLLAFLPFAVQAQAPLLPAAKSPAATSPAAKPAPSAGAQFSEQQLREMIAKLQDRIQHAADAVIGRIEKMEADIHLRFSYLRKPARLDPNSYASKDDITSWRTSVQQLRDMENTLDKLYANVETDLGTALIQQQINPAIADQIRNELLKSFPWPAIKKKSELMKQFIDEHEELLAFYDKNWGTWKRGPTPGTAVFDDPTVSATFQTLKGKISTIGQQIDDQYTALVQ